MSLVKNLVRDYGNFKIEIPEWEIPDQGISVLWGPSGSGKTSVFRLLMGLEECPGLSWVFHGQDLNQLSVSAKKLGVVFQSLELFPHMTGTENVLFAAHARKISQASSKLQELSHLLKLDLCIGKNVGLMSGGEKQRVALARALIGEPRFLFLDEPFSALDEDLRQEARSLVKTAIEKYKIPTLLITHDHRDIEVLANNVFKILAGKLTTHQKITKM